MFIGWKHRPFSSAICGTVMNQTPPKPNAPFQNLQDIPHADQPTLSFDVGISPTFCVYSKYTPVPQIAFFPVILYILFAQSSGCPASLSVSVLL